MLVARPRLRKVLDTQAPLTLLRAPIGFGKTTLVAQWVAGLGDDEPDSPTGLVAWLRVRPGAGDATTFWADVLQVISEAAPPAPSDAAPRSGDADLAGRAERALRAVDGPVVLIVDGFEHVTAPDLDRALLDLLQHLPQLRLVVCLRTHRHFPAYLSLDLETVVLTAADLRFTEDETRQLLATADVELPAYGVRTIVEDCGGWPEPIRAVALRLRESAGTTAEQLTDVVEGIAADYLRERLLDGNQLPGRVEFALATSLPEEFTVEIAEVLSDDGSARSQLEALGGGVLTTELRDGKVVYQWPPAARQALLGELRRRWPERVGELHGRLARWHFAEGQMSLALDHAVSAADWQLVIKVIESSWRALVFESDDRVARALMEVPIELLATSPRAVALRDSKLRLPDQLFATVANLPGSAAELAALGQGEEAAEVLDTCFAVLIAWRKRGAVDSASTYGARALDVARAARVARPQEVASLYPTLHLQVGLTHLLGGDLGAAIAALQVAHERGADNPLGYVEGDAAAKLALAHAVTGDLREATIWMERHDSIRHAGHTWLNPLIGSATTAAELLVTLDRLEFDPAIAAHDLLVAHTQRDELWPYLTYARAQLSLVVGTASEALTLIDRARTTYRDWAGTGAIARPLLAAAEADLLLALGRGNLARAVLNGPDADHPLLRVARARLALLAGEDEVAVQLSQDSGWERATTARDRHAMLVIRSIAAARTGRLDVAETALRRAVDLTRVTGSLRPFAGVPRDDLASLAKQVPAARDLLSKDPLATQLDLFPAEVRVIALTEREQRVLEDMADGLTVQQIADASVLSYNTVRSQQRSLYRKLGTSSRHEAIARARQWGLLSQDR